MAKVLIVDDAIFVRAAMKKYVEKAGHEVVGEASDGKESIELFKELEPDGVIMDITMPRMSGIEALKIIKGINSDVKVIMCSAIGQQEAIAAAIQNGASDFVIKPFTEEQIVAKIRQVLG